MRCEECGAANGPTVKFCAACGNRLALSGFADTHPGFGSTGPGSLSQSPPPRPARAPSHTSLRELYAMAIGPKNQAHYLRRFEAFDRQGRTSIGWHWPAFFVTFYWLLYRKLWGKAALYFFVPYLAVTLLAALAGAIHPAAEGVVYLAYVLALFTLPAMYADAAYYARCRRLVQDALAKHRTRQDLLIELAQKGQTSHAALVVVATLGTVSLVGILAAVAIPAYQDYTMRAKTAQALTHGKAAALAVGNFYETRKRLPNTLGDTSFELPLPKELQNIQLDPRTGAIRLVVNGGGPVAMRTFFLTPTAAPNGRVVWACGAGEMRVGVLPRECRGEGR